MNLTPEKEEQILEALKAKIESVPNASNVIADEPFFDSKQDYVKKLTVLNVENVRETKYIKIDYLGWRDSATDGCDDNPVVFLKYKLRSFQQYKEVRSDLSTSAKDIKVLDINLRNKFLEAENNARLLAPNSEHRPLVLISDIILDVDEPTGIYGHIAEYSIEVELT